MKRTKSLDELVAAPGAAPATACAKCGGPADTNPTADGPVTVLLWDHPACYGCIAEWEQGAPLAGDAAKAHSWDNTAQAMREYTAKWLKAGA